MSAFRGIVGFALAISALGPQQALAQAQNRMNPDGEWRYQSADAWGTRYSPNNQVDASNFAKRLKGLRGLTPYERICQLWTECPERFRLNPHHHTVGLEHL